MYTDNEIMTWTWTDWRHSLLFDGTSRVSTVYWCHDKVVTFGNVTSNYYWQSATTNRDSPVPGRTPRGTWCHGWGDYGTTFLPSLSRVFSMAGPSMASRLVNKVSIYTYWSCTVHCTLVVACHALNFMSIASILITYTTRAPSSLAESGTSDSN